ncbi:MAG TPA: hypothetical protein VGW96_08025 [Candidatus Eremiobacteraceae bacterium]|nr:hypothetical protein [Candidatus Eremiobacteraceae bacterium]
MIRRYVLFALLALGIWVAPAIVRADTGCDSVYAQDLARQGYRYLDAHRWQDARMAAGQLALYARGCSDPKVGYPSVVHSAYIGSAALHGLGENDKAAKTVQMGMVVLQALKNEGGFASLYDAMEPKFSELAHEVAPVAASAAPVPASPAP